MGLADDLLAQANHLATRDSRKPKQANLRRAVSTAYYALFHLLVTDSVRRISPKTPSSLAPRIERAFTHTEMKQVCRSITAQNPSEIVRELQPAGFSVGLRLVAQWFVELQEARHRADYDPTATYDRTETLELLRTAGAAFAEWRKIRTNDEANVFLAALLFAGRWTK